VRKQILIVFLVLVFAVSSVAAGTFSAGVSVGGSLAFVGVEPSGEGSPRYGFTGGLYGDYAFYSMGEMVDFSVQSGVYYAMKGFRASKVNVESVGVVEGDLTVNHDYIEVPLLVKASFPLDLPVDPYLLVGPAVSYRIINTVSMESTHPATSAIVDDIEGKYQSLDFGVVFGAGVDLDMGISVDARFNLGLLNIEDEPSGDDYTKNRSISLMVSYNIL